MKSVSILSFLLLVFASTVAAQSLGELAKKEKERREKNKEAGTKVYVVEQSDLAEGEVEDASDEETAAALPASERSTRAPSASGRPRTEVSTPPRRPPGSGSSAEEYVEDDDEDDDEDEDEAPSAISLEVDLQQRLRDFDLMKRDYQRQVQEIDEKIATNRQRIAEIEQRLSSLGAGGLPVAPQPDMGAQYEGDFHGLMEEKGRLAQENERLEAQKQTLKRELIEKGRRGGLPASYLRF